MEGRVNGTFWDFKKLNRSKRFDKEGHIKITGERSNFFEMFCAKRESFKESL